MGKLSMPDCPNCRDNKYVKMRTINQSNGIFGPGARSIVLSFDFYCIYHPYVFVDLREEAKNADYYDYEKVAVKDD